MDVWTKIKNEMTKGTVRGSFGYFSNVLNAADVFSAILPELKDVTKQTESFNADPDVTYVLMNRKKIEAILWNCF